VGAQQHAAARRSSLQAVAEVCHVETAGTRQQDIFLIFFFYFGAAYCENRTLIHMS
jgi:hypothetical protein